MLQSINPSRFQSFREATNPDWDEEEHPRGKTTDDSTPGSFAPSNESSALSIDQAQDAYDDMEVPPGWFVHGRRGQHTLRDDAVIQLTDDIDVADFYAGESGSIWYIRPRADATVLDLSNEDTGDTETLREQFVSAYDDGLFPDQDVFVHYDHYGNSTQDTADEAWEKARKDFAPEDIVDSARAYDNTEWVNWLYERTGAQFVIVPSGAVVLDSDAIETVKIPKINESMRESEPIAGTRFDTAPARKRKVKPVPGSELAIAEEILAAGGTVADIVKEIGILTPDIVALAGEAGMGADALALKIDANLNTRVWAGTKFEDRMGHMVQTLRTDLIQQMENSLMAQERYEDFELRTSKALGIDTDEKMGPLQKFWNQVNGEAKLAWNEGMIEANMGADTALVWRALLDSKTTPGCISRSGLLIYDDLGGSTPPRHWGCVLPGTGVRGNFSVGLRSYYTGKVRKLKTRGNNVLTVTPNHPIATRSGLKAASLINKGDQVLTYLAGNKKEPSICPTGMAQEIQNAPSMIEDVFQSLLFSCGEFRRAQSSHDDLHGDAMGGDGYIDVVATDRKLLDYLMPQASSDVSNLGFKPMNSTLTEHAGDGNLFPLSVGVDSSSSGLPSTAQVPFHLGSIGANLLPANDQGFATAPDRCSEVAQLSAKRFPADSSLPGKGQHGDTISVLARNLLDIRNRADAISLAPLTVGTVAGVDTMLLKASNQYMVGDSAVASNLVDSPPIGMEFDEVVEVFDEYFAGHVYDLQSITGLLIANNIVISNCRCDVLTIPNPQSTDPDRAAQGQAILEAMATEREAWGGDVADMAVESAKPFIPSRFKYFREAQGPDDEEGHWVTIRGNPVFLKGPGPEKQTDTAAFKKWFGDSRVVDKDGQPLRVYHGTRKDFTDFRPSKDGSGIYFTASPDTAYAYAIRFGSTPLDSEFDKLRADLISKGMSRWDVNKTPEWKDLEQQARLYGSNVVPVYLSMRRPLELDGITQSDMVNVIKDSPQEITKLRKQGHDGIIVRNALDSPNVAYTKDDQALAGKRTTVYVVFKPTQIKSAIGNKGTFNPKSPSIIESYKPSRFLAFREVGQWRADDDLCDDLSDGVAAPCSLE